MQVSWKYWYLSHSIYDHFKNTSTAIDSVCGGGGGSLNKLSLTKPPERTVFLAQAAQLHVLSSIRSKITVRGSVAVT